MPVVPSFSSFARGPDLVGAAHTARQEMLDAERLAAQTAIERQQLAQRAQEAMLNYQLSRMQLAAAEQARQSEARREEQQIEITKAYNTQRLALDAREVAIREQAAMEDIQASGVRRELESQYQEIFSQSKAAGASDEEAARKAGLATGWRGMSGLPAVAFPPGPGGGEQGAPIVREIPGVGRAVGLRATGGDVREQLIADPIRRESSVTMVIGVDEQMRPITDRVPMSEVRQVLATLPPELKAHMVNTVAASRASLSGSGWGEGTQPPGAGAAPKTIKTKSGKSFEMLEFR